jgi:hypothetical protein
VHVTYREASWRRAGWTGSVVRARHSRFVCRAPHSDRIIETWRRKRAMAMFAGGTTGGILWEPNCNRLQRNHLLADTDPIAPTRARLKSPQPSHKNRDKSPQNRPRLSSRRQRRIVEANPPNSWRLAHVSGALPQPPTEGAPRLLRDVGKHKHQPSTLRDSNLEENHDASLRQAGALHLGRSFPATAEGAPRLLGDVGEHERQPSTVRNSNFESNHELLLRRHGPPVLESHAGGDAELHLRRGRPCGIHFLIERGR